MAVDIRWKGNLRLICSISMTLMFVNKYCFEQCFTFFQNKIKLLLQNKSIRRNNVSNIQLGVSTFNTIYIIIVNEQVNIGQAALKFIPRIQHLGIKYYQHPHNSTLSHIFLCVIPYFASHFDANMEWHAQICLTTHCNPMIRSETDKT